MKNQSFLKFIPLLFSLQVPPLFASDCPEFPYFQPEKGPLAVLNCDMHKSYEARVSQFINTFGSPGGRPVILNLGGRLIFKYNGQTQQANLAPNNYQQIKAISHLGLSIFLVLNQRKAGILSESTRQKLTLLYQHTLAAQADIPNLKFSAAAAQAANQLLTTCAYFIQSTLKEDNWSKEGLAKFYQKLDQPFKVLIYTAAQTELDILEQTTTRWLALLNKQDKANLGIVVATVHQARAQEVSIQYFLKKFHQHLGVGAMGENKIIVVEGQFDEDSALKALARHYLDREIGQAIFHDSEGMQHDLLAASAKKILN